MPDAQPDDQPHAEPGAEPHDQPDAAPHGRAGGELHLAVALDGAGWHPAAWREPDARPQDLFSAGYWADLAIEAERGLLDFITIEDSLGIQSANRFGGVDDRVDQVRGRLDAVLIAARIAPLTSHIGIVPTGTMTHTEPFHLSTALATLDYVSGGRAGWRAQLSPQPEQARHFGHREVPAAGQQLHRPGRPQHSGNGSTRARTSSRSSGGCGTPGRTTRSSATSPPAASSTATSCTTSTSRAAGSASAGRRSRPARRRASCPSWRWRTLRFPTSSPPAPPTSCSSPPAAPTTRSRSWRRCGRRRSVGREMAPRQGQRRPAGTAQRGRGLGPLQVYADLTVFLDDSGSAAIARKQRLDRADGADYRNDTAIFTGTAAAAGRPAAGLAAHGPGGLPAAARRAPP